MLELLCLKLALNHMINQNEFKYSIPFPFLRIIYNKSAWCIIYICFDVKQDLLGSLLTHVLILGLHWSGFKWLGIKIKLSHLTLCLGLASLFITYSFTLSPLKSTLPVSQLSFDWLPFANKRFEQQVVELMCSQPELCPWDNHIKDIRIHWHVWSSLKVSD